MVLNVADENSPLTRAFLGGILWGMSTATISRIEYERIAKRQDELVRRVDLIEKEFHEYTRDGVDEIRPEYAKKLERMSGELDEKKKGVRFSSAREMKKYLDAL